MGLHEASNSGKHLSNMTASTPSQAKKILQCILVKLPKLVQKLYLIAYVYVFHMY